MHHCPPPPLPLYQRCSIILMTKYNQTTSVAASIHNNELHWVRAAERFPQGPWQLQALTKGQVQAVPRVDDCIGSP